MFKKLIGVLAVFFAVFFAVAAVGWLALKRADLPYETLEIAYANEASQFVRLEDGLKVHYRDEGPRDGRPLVLIHGFSASVHTWEAWVEDLQADYRVISIDLPAHGLTRAPEDYPMGIDSFVKTVREVTEFLGVERFTIVGSSMGGATAWGFAQDHPEKLDGLVLVGASGWPDTSEDDGGQPLIFRLLASPTARWLMQDLDMTLLIRGGLEDSFVDQSFVTDEMVDRYSALSRAPGHRPAILRLMSNTDGRREATPEIMAQLTMPTLVLHGDTDNLVPVEGGRRFAETIPDAELIIYENIGHLPQEERAAQSVADLRNFLTRKVYVNSEAEPELAPAEAETAEP